MIKKITIVLALLFMCTGIYAQTKNISVGFVPYGHSYEYGNCLKYGVTLDYERRFSDLSGNAGGLTLSGTYFYGNFPKDNHSFSFNVGMEWILNAKGRVQFPLGLEFGLGKPLEYSLVCATAKIRVYITDNLGVFAGSKITCISKILTEHFYGIISLNFGIVYTIGK